MKIIENIDTCSKLVGKKVIYENIVYKIIKFVCTVDNFDTNHYLLKLLELEDNRNLYLTDKEIRLFFKKCKFVE